ncbi:BTB/POZ protein [Aspergillus californicus]
MSTPNTPPAKPETPASKPASDITAKPPASILHGMMRDLLLNGDYSDMTVTCEGHTFRVHQAVLCSQSPFFKGAMKSGFKEGISHAIELPADDVGTVERVVTFIYYEDYEQDGHVLDLESKTSIPSIPPSTGKEQRSASYNNLRVYIAADKFGIEPLKKLASERFEHCCKKTVDDDSFLEVIEDVMTMAPHDLILQAIISRVVAANVESLVDNGSIRPVLERHGRLASAVIAQMVEDGKKTKARLEEERKANRDERVRCIPSCSDCFARQFPDKVRARKERYGVCCFCGDTYAC